MSDPDPFKDRLIELARLKAAKAATAAAAKDAGTELAQYQDNLWTAMDDAGVDGSAYTGVGRFDRKSTVYGQIIDLDAFVEWAKEQGLDDVLHLKENPGRLNEIVRDCLDNEEELPPGVSFYDKHYISFTKRKKETP